MGAAKCVLYALPELDGAIDPVLGGLVGEDISNSGTGAAPIGRLKRWIALRQTPPAQRRMRLSCTASWLRRWNSCLAECAAITPQIPSGTKDHCRGFARRW